MRYFLILLFTFTFTQELQVEGDLTVSGDINSAIIDSLQNQVLELNLMLTELLESNNINSGYGLIANPQGGFYQSNQYEDSILFETTFEAGSLEQILHIEFYSSSTGNLRFYFGAVGSEIQIGSFNQYLLSSSKQFWVNYPIGEELINETTRLYIFAPGDGSGSTSISQLFIWGN
jgi:hypothetical protein